VARGVCAFRFAEGQEARTDLGALAVEGFAEKLEGRVGCCTGVSDTLDGCGAFDDPFTSNFEIFKDTAPRFRGVYGALLILAPMPSAAGAAMVGGPEVGLAAVVWV
jgi:hypothetical protein